MRILRTAVLLLAFCIGRFAFAQTVSVVDSDPANGSVGMPLETQIRFTFNEELAVTNDWNSVISVEPRDSIHISRVALLVDDQSVPRIVTYTVTHTADTDFSWLVHSVESFGGSGMAEPFVLRYSTSADLGEREVAGSVLSPAPSKQGIASTTQSTLAKLARALDMRGTPAFRKPTTGAEKGGVATRPASSNYTEILLLKDFSVEEPEWDISAASVILGAEGSYAVHYVRPGLYFPVAAHYSDDAIDALGFFDENDDGAPDVLNVGSMNRQEIEIQGYAFPRVGAETYVDRARSAYPGGDVDDLVLISDEYGSTPQGTSFVWSYDFYDADQNRLITVEVDPLLESTTAVTASSHVPQMNPIGNEFVGSEAALVSVLASGGSEFLESVPERDLRTVIEGGNQYWLLSGQGTTTFWRVRFFNLRNGDLYEAFVDMESGSVITGVEDVPEVAQRTWLGPNYPNPFATTTSIPVSLAEPSSVRLTVYNMLGQKVALLVDGDWLPAGRHVVEWTPAGMAGGAYLCELQVGPSRLTRVIVHRR